MLKEFVNKILELAEVERLVYQDRDYTSKSIHPVRPPRITSELELEFTSLDGLLMYVNNNVDNFDKMIIHVENHQSVSVFSPITQPWLQRHEFVCADLRNHSDGFKFGRWFNQEEFIIGLQSQFLRTTETEKILKCVGNIKSEEVRNASDDGVSQSVTAKKGVALVTEVKVPNPVLLAPYRTFREIDQPGSQFILRVRENGSSCPEIALFEADGGKWKLEAMSRIHAYLNDNTSDEIKVLM